MRASYSGNTPPCQGGAESSILFARSNNKSPLNSLSMIDGDIQNIKSAINGEASAFGLLYDKYQPQIYRFIYLKVSHREEAEDLCHQVFLSAWQNMGSYEFKGFPFSTWLYSIARNKVIDYYRTKKNFIDIETIYIAEEDDKKTNESILDFKISIDGVKKAISEIPQIEQDVIIMRFVEDMSPQEIAPILNKSEGLIRAIQHKAIKRLKELLN